MNEPNVILKKLAGEKYFNEIGIKYIVVGKRKYMESLIIRE